MSQNLYDTANTLERELRQSKEFQALKEAFSAVRGNEEAKRVFENFQAITLKFQDLQLNGQQPSEEELENAQTAAKVAHENELFARLMTAEQAMSVLMADLNRIITLPLSEIYQANQA